MSERNPFTHRLAYAQGRLQPTGWKPTDGSYVFVLGAEDRARYNFLYNDYVEVKQDLDLTGIDVLRVDSKIVQPTMPGGRDVSGTPKTAVLQRGHVLTSLDLRTELESTMVHPGTETQLKEPFQVNASTFLRVEVDSGGDLDIAFPSSPAVVDMTAQQVVDQLNPTLTANNALAQVRTVNGESSVVITADGTGKTHTIEVKDYPTPALDANNHLQFFQKVAVPPFTTDTKIYGGDDLSAIIAPDANFTEADANLPLQITGATVDPGNNLNNYIDAVLDENRAVLRLPVSAEPAGFSAVIRQALWEISVVVNSIEVVSRKIESGRTVLTDDIAANVSKLSGSQEVLFRLRLRPA